MSKIKYFSDDLNIEGKVIILRLDLNVPLNNKKIQDHTRIIQNIPFLKDLILKKAKIIIKTLNKKCSFISKKLSKLIEQYILPGGLCHLFPLCPFPSDCWSDK